MKRMTGTVTDFAEGFYVIDAPDAPPHVRSLNLRGWQTKGAQVGDRVVLEYQTTARYGLWNVVDILEKE